MSSNTSKNINRAVEDEHWFDLEKEKIQEKYPRDSSSSMTELKTLIISLTCKIDEMNKEVAVLRNNTSTLISEVAELRFLNERQRNRFVREGRPFPFVPERNHEQKYF